MISLKGLEALQIAIEKVQEACRSHKSDLPENAATTTDFKAHIESALSSSNDVFKEAEKKIKKKSVRKNALEITLDDAVEALSNMKEEAYPTEKVTDSRENIIEKSGNCVDEKCKPSHLEPP